jgi:tetratricopeptide (TPR) repeat protein
MSLILSGCALDPIKLILENDLINYRIKKDAEALYKKKKYEQALVGILMDDPESIKKPSVQKLLKRINDRIITAQWYLQKSIAALERGELEKAKFHVNKSLSVYPDHLHSHLMQQALTSMNLPQQKKKIQEVKIISKKDLELAEFYFTSGQNHLKIGQSNKAKISWYKGLALAPSHAKTRSALTNLLRNEGLLFFGQGELKAAIKSWESALKISPHDPKIKTYMNNALKLKKNVQNVDQNQ